MKPSDIVEQTKSTNHRHRFYENKFPNLDECVVVQVTNIQENASYVELLEYDNIQGMIPPNEATKSMRQTMQKALKVGKQQVVKVLRVDQEKGYIDLSKVKVSPAEEGKALERFNKSKTIHSILNNMVNSKVIAIEDAYTKIVYPLNIKGENCFEALRAALTDRQILQGLQITKEAIDVLQAEIKRRMTPPVLKIVANFKLTCNDFDGIDAIKSALRAGKSQSRNNYALVFRILGSPIYQGIVETSDRNSGVEVMKEGLQAIDETIKTLNGTYSLQDTIQVYGQKSNQPISKEEDDLDDSDDENEDDDSEIEGMGDDDDDDDDDEISEETQKNKQQ